jgi:uncharacterized membrane protein YraQ (UPF0718 family)
VDSIALTYALLGPIMAIVRPVVAFVTAFVAGLAENTLGRSYTETQAAPPDLTCAIDGCCDGVDCDPQEHAHHHSLGEKFRFGIGFAFNELFDDVATWFMIGILLAGAIGYLTPEAFFENYVGSGLASYLVMLGVSLPLYVCATMSTPIAAALILKGLSPGAALVFLVAGPATNVATLTVVGALLGKRTVAIYLTAIVVCTLLFGFVTDAIYSGLGTTAHVSVMAGAASEFFPDWLQWIAAVVVLVLSVRTLWRKYVQGGGEDATETQHHDERAHDQSDEGRDCCADAQRSGST